MSQEQLDKFVAAMAQSDYAEFQNSLKSQDINALSVDGLSLLGIAICAGDKKAVEMLLDAGASPQMECHLINDYPAEGCNDSIKLGNLLAEAMEKGYSSTRCQDEETQIVELISPLRIAMNAKEQDVALMLVKAGACDELSKDQLTSLFHSAARHNLDKVMCYMIQMGFDPNCLSKDGKSPLMEAACSGAMECVSILLKAGANRHQRCAEGLSALDYAKCAGAMAVVEMMDLSR